MYLQFEIGNYALVDFIQYPAFGCSVNAHHPVYVHLNFETILIEKVPFLFGKIQINFKSVALCKARHYVITVNELRILYVCRNIHAVIRKMIFESQISVHARRI